MRRLSSPPLTEIEKVARTQKCAVCGGKLEAYAEYDYKTKTMTEPIVRCRMFPEHAGIVRKYEPAPELNYESWREEMTTEVGPVRTNQLARYYGMPTIPEVDLRKIIITLWPDAPEVERYKALMLCKQYNLNPLRNQVFIIGFDKKEKRGDQWVSVGKTFTTVLGIKSNRQIAAEAGPAYSYLDNTPRLMSDDEQTKIMGMVDPNNLWAITKLKDAKGNAAQGYGNWPKAKAVQGGDKGNTPFNMACIRSERQALDRLRPGCMPQDVEVMDESFAPKVEAVNTQTGEIIEGTAELPSNEPTVEGHFEPEPPKHDPPALKRDPATIKTTTDLIKACGEDFNMKSVEVLKETGYSSWADCAELPAELYVKIHAVKV